jgi:predicted dehydrogenase
MAGKQINIAMIGHGFMGRAHSNAWTQVARFFDPPITPVMHTVFGRDDARASTFANRWGWRDHSTNWPHIVAHDEIGLVDIVTPTAVHTEPVLAALEGGKAVACEKPLAGTLENARKLVEAARKSKSPNFVWYNYRRVPAVALAHQVVSQGRLGAIRHVRGFYLQDWATPDVPLIWRFDRNKAGSGSHGDLNAHVVDMVRFVTGLEFTEICGAMAETFVKERTVQAGGAAGGIAAGTKSGEKKGRVTVDDAVLFLARMKGGALAQFEATRLATGNQNKVGFEINGSDGALRFNFERMNELEFYDATTPRALQGWRTIMVTHAGSHAYAHAWWPDAHVLGYEHSFTNMAADILAVLGGQQPVAPLPDFADAYRTQRVLEAAMISAREKQWIKLSQVK